MMRHRFRLLGIAGSLREGAFSTAVLRALADASADRCAFDYATIGDLPHFNEDLCITPLPSAVEHFRGQISQADGVVISSTEYNHGMPGVLKNALDWASRPHNESPLRDKPVLIVTSSTAFTGGVRAQYQLRETLAAALARPVNTPEIVIGSVAEKIRDGRFQHEASIAFALAGISALCERI